MNFSILDLFTIGIGPSSSHTVGPMRAAAEFMAKAQELPRLNEVRCDLYGSLAATGKGHGTDNAILLGWLGNLPDSIEVATIPQQIKDIDRNRRIELPGNKIIACDPYAAIHFNRDAELPHHPNGMHFTAIAEDESILLDEVVYSIGGGFIVRENEIDSTVSTVTVPIPFSSGDELLENCKHRNLSIAEVAFENETAFRPAEETRSELDRIWEAMQSCVASGCHAEGTLPGGLKVQRRAGKIWKKLMANETSSGFATQLDPLQALDWINLFALAVNEENAAGGRVVTAPTNGAAGIIPAVLHFATRFRKSPHDDGVHRFLLTAGAIAMLYKENASLSGADVGCQGEVGVACSMAAGAMVEYLGGTAEQVECAAEIGMEHNLGLTCDPVGGLVQVPCIERNAMASVKAINAARLAMKGDGTHIVSLDKVIATMRETGRDMMSKYKETSRGGLAVNFPEC